MRINHQSQFISSTENVKVLVNGEAYFPLPSPSKALLALSIARDKTFVYISQYPFEDNFLERQPFNDFSSVYPDRNNEAYRRHNQAFSNLN